MSNKVYTISLEEDLICPIRTYIDGEFICSHASAMDPITREYNCKGILAKRPDWCPLKENKFKGIYHTESGWEG